MSARKLPGVVENLPSVSETWVLVHFWALAREAMICSNLPFCTMTGYLRSGLRNSPDQGQHKLVRSLRIPQGGSRECAVWKVLCGFMKRAHLQQNVATAL